MTLIERIVVECEWCKRTVTTNTGDRLKALRIIRNKGWIDHLWDMYGNSSQFCCVECLKHGLQLAGVGAKPCVVCGYPGYETEKCDKCASLAQSIKKESP